MTGGIKFCGGCNPRYDRGKAFNIIKERLKDKVVFSIADEGKEYDFVLIIGGCTNCCASYEQYRTRKGYIRMWDENHIENTIQEILELEE